MDRQPENSRMPSPTPGASIGTTMKTIVMKDITRDISRPSKRSRTMASAMTRGEAAPMPCRTLAARRPENEEEATASRVPQV